MKYNINCVMLWVGISLLILPSIHSRASDSLEESWHDQQENDLSDGLANWKKVGKGPATDGTIVKQDDKKILTIKATSDQPFDPFGITAKNNFDFAGSLEISVDVAFSQQDGSTLGSNYQPSFMIVVSGGKVCYQLNVRPHHIQIGKNDPEHPNPNAAARDPNFTVLFKSEENGPLLTSDDFQNFKLKMTRSSAGIQLTVVHGPDETELGTILDATPADLGELVSVSISVENYAVLKIAGVKITAN